MTNTVFQMPLPSPVSSTNCQAGNFVVPAGSEMRLRKIGTSRPKKTAFRPCRRNQSAAVSKSRSSSSGILEMTRRVRSSPSQRASPYTTRAPTSEPTVVQMSASASDIVPCPAANPASGRMSSLGMGGKRFSTAMRNPAPGPPTASITATAQSPMNPSEPLSSVAIPATIGRRSAPAPAG